MELVSWIGHNVGWFLVVLTALVFVHELGHYAIARRNGVRVEVFSVGFGPELFGFTDKVGTRWKFSAIPLGGYVKMFGEASLESHQDVVMTPDQKAVSFSHKRLGQRAAIVFAGPAANFIFAIIVLAGLFMVAGRPMPQEFVEAGIGGVVEGSAADQAGLVAGDRIRAVDGAPIGDFFDLKTAVEASEGRPLAFEIQRDDTVFTATVTPRIVTSTTDAVEIKAYRLGVYAPGPTYVRLGPLSAVWQAVVETWRLTLGTLAAVGEIIVGDRGADELGGPLRIAKLSGDFAESGVVTLFGFMALLSINLGLINLFPIPILDGGHLLFYAIEAVRGRPLGERAQEYGLRIGLALILSLMVFVTINDFVHLSVLDFIRDLLT